LAAVPIASESRIKKQVSTSICHSITCKTGKGYGERQGKLILRELNCTVKQMVGLPLKFPTWFPLMSYNFDAAIMEVITY
jgi:hypothetical protein